MTCVMRHRPRSNRYLGLFFHLASCAAQDFYSRFDLRRFLRSSAKVLLPMNSAVTNAIRMNFIFNSSSLRVESIQARNNMPTACKRLAALGVHDSTAASRLDFKLHVLLEP